MLDPQFHMRTGGLFFGWLLDQVGEGLAILMVLEAHTKGVAA